MLRILYVPVDERPVNRIFPQNIASRLGGIELVMPPKELLGFRHDAGDTEALWRFVREQIPSCQEAILSLDMLVYGGLVASRTHALTKEEVLWRAERFAGLRPLNPRALITVCAMVMRVPHYNSSSEEPAYYAQYGEKLFGISWFTDKLARGRGEEGDQEKLRELEGQVPGEIRADFFGRREMNFAATARVLEMLSEGSLNAMVLPQDDTAAFGVQSGEQARHLAAARRMGVSHMVHCHPGADEAGMELLARAVNRRQRRGPKVFVRYSSVDGASIIPLYEDRPYGESIKAHILSSGCMMADSPQEADFILMVNTPGMVCTEAFDQDKAPRTNMTHRNLGEFVQAMREYIRRGVPVAVSDVAYANGADLELIELMQAERVLGGLCAYGGWNTHCNTLGSVLSVATAAVNGADTRPLVIERLLEDAGYMALVRQELRAKVEEGTWPEEAYGQADSELYQEAHKRMNRYLEKEILPFCSNISAKLTSVNFPWARSFEIELELAFTYKEEER